VACDIVDGFFEDQEYLAARLGIKSQLTSAAGASK
jgi:hypothetical protein